MATIETSVRFTVAYGGAIWTAVIEVDLEYATTSWRERTRETFEAIVRKNPTSVLLVLEYMRKMATDCVGVYRSTGSDADAAELR